MNYIRLSGTLLAINTSSKVLHHVRPVMLAQQQLKSHRPNALAQQLIGHKDPAMRL